MKLKIDHSQLNQLESLKQCMLLDDDNNIYSIYSFKVIKETENVKIFKFFKTNRTKDVYYLIEISIEAYSKTGNYCKFLDKEDAEKFIKTKNLNNLRNNWLVFKKSLSSFGFNLRSSSNGRY
jgi:hypothetical protein